MCATSSIGSTSAAAILQAAKASATKGTPRPASQGAAAAVKASSGKDADGDYDGDAAGGEIDVTA